MELVASEIIERIKSHLSPKELESIGFNTQAVSGWKLHNRIPKSEDLYKISQAIGVSMEYLLTGELKENMTDEDAVVLAYFHSIPDYNKQLFKNILKLMANK